MITKLKGVRSWSQRSWTACARLSRESVFNIFTDSCKKCSQSMSCSIATRVWVCLTHLLKSWLGNEQALMTDISNLCLQVFLPWLMLPVEDLLHPTGQNSQGERREDLVVCGMLGFRWTGAKNGLSLVNAVHLAASWCYQSSVGTIRKWFPINYNCSLPISCVTHLDFFSFWKW